MKPTTKAVSTMPAPSVAPISQPMEAENILTKEELASRLKVSSRVVYNMTRTRSQSPIPFFRAGKELRFNWSVVSAWLQNQPRREFQPRKRKKPDAQKKAA